MADNTQLITYIEADISKFQSAIYRATQSADLFATNWKRANTEVSNSFNMLTKAGVAFYAATKGFAFLKDTEKTFRDFSRAIAELSAITGATGKDLEYIKNQAMALGQSTAFNATEIANAMKLVGAVQADLLDNLPALKQVTEQVVLLSTASGQDIENTARAVGNALNQWGAGADQASRFVNVLAAGSRNGSAEVDDLAISLKYAGPVAAQLGLSIEETVAMLELLAKAGIKGSTAGTGMRQVLLRLAKDADSTINPRLTKIGDVLNNLAAKNLTAAEASKKFGITAVSSGLSLLKESKNFDAMTKSVTGTDLALEQASTKLDSYAGRIDKLSAAWQGLQITLGESSEGGWIVKSATQDLNALSKAIKEYGLVGGLVKGLTIDPIRNSGDAIAQSIGRLYSGSDAGATETTKPLKDRVNDIQFRANALMKYGKDPIDEKINFLKNQWVDAFEQLKVKVVGVKDIIGNELGVSASKAAAQLDKVMTSAEGAAKNMLGIVGSAINGANGVGKDAISRGLASGQGLDNQISRILYRTDKKEVAVNSEFDDRAAKLVSQINSGTISANEVDSTLKNLTQMAKGEGVNTAFSSAKDNTAMLYAIGELRKYAKDRLNAEAVQVDVKIEADADGVFRAVVSRPGFKEITSEMVKNVAALEARKVRN